MLAGKVCHFVREQDRNGMIVAIVRSGLHMLAQAPHDVCERDSDSGQVACVLDV
jgi:hypothetical protein